MGNDAWYDNHYASSPGHPHNGTGVDPGRPQVVVVPVVQTGGPWGNGWYGLSSTQRNIYFGLSVVTTILFIVLAVYFIYNWNKTSEEFDKRFG